MALLKEDGTLDIERINQLPIEDYMKEVGNFTNEQRKEYYSKSPKNEPKEPVHPVNVDYTLEEDIERNGTALLGNLLYNLNKIYGINEQDVINEIESGAFKFGKRPDKAGVIVVDSIDDFMKENNAIRLEEMDKTFGLVGEDYIKDLSLSEMTEEYDEAEEIK